MAFNEKLRDVIGETDTVPVREVQLVESNAQPSKSIHDLSYSIGIGDPCDFELI